MLTLAQLQILKADISADPLLSAKPNTPDAAYEIAEIYNTASSPPFWVYKTWLTEEEMTDKVSVDGTSFSWTAFIARSQGERDAWRTMIGTRSGINPSLPNVRLGMQDIFSGGTGATQRTHLAAVARRIASRIEKLFANGTGSTAAPATMEIESPVSYQEIYSARNLP